MASKLLTYNCVAFPLLWSPVAKVNDLTSETFWETETYSNGAGIRTTGVQSFPLIVSWTLPSGFSLTRRILMGLSDRRGFGKMEEGESTCVCGWCWSSPGGSKVKCTSFTSDTLLHHFLEAWTYSDYSWTIPIKLFPWMWRCNGFSTRPEAPTLMSCVSLSDWLESELKTSDFRSLKQGLDVDLAAERLIHEDLTWFTSILLSIYSPS